MSDQHIATRQLVDSVMLKPRPRASAIDRAYHRIQRYSAYFRLRALTMPRMESELRNLVHQYRPMSRCEFQTEIDSLRLAGKPEPGLTDRAVALAQVAMERQRNTELPVDLCMRARCCLMGTVQEEEADTKDAVLILAAAAAAMVGLPVMLLSEQISRVAQLYENYSFYFSSLGMVVGLVSEKSSKESRRKQYAGQVVLATTRQATNDYLLDMLLDGGDQSYLRAKLEPLLKPAASRQRYMHREPGILLLDGAKRQLVDLALSPVTVSGGDGHLWTKEALSTASSLAKLLKDNEHFHVLGSEPFIILSDAGKDLLLDQAAKLPGIWQSTRLREELVVEALLVRDVLQRGADYEVGPSGLVLKRAYLEPHRPALSRERLQLLKIKEGLGAGDDPEVLCRISIPGFFSRFAIVGGLTESGKKCPVLAWCHYGVLQMDALVGRSRKIGTMESYIYPSEYERIAAALDSAEQILDDNGLVLLPVYARDRYPQLESLLADRFTQLPQTPLSGSSAFSTARGRGKLLLLPKPLVDRFTATNEDNEIVNLLILEAPAQFELPSLESLEVDGLGGPIVQVHLCLADGLLTSSLPAMLRGFLGSRAKPGKPWRGIIAAQVLEYCQRAEKQSTARRLREVRKMDLNYNKLLAFAGIVVPLWEKE